VVDVDGGDRRIVIEVVEPRNVDRAEYIAALNRSFPGWGADATFDWCFQRVVAGRAPDLLIVRDGGKLIAGSGVVYRNVETTGGETVCAGVLCGAWTDPEARGRGLFSDITEAARALVRPRGGVALLAFVRAQNASSRRLFAMGWTMLPARYLRRREARMGSSPEKCECLPAHFARELTHFVYTDEEWLGQFIRRPQPVQCVAGEGWRAIMEENRLLDLAGDRERALADLGEVSAYSTTSEEWPGFESTPGFLGIIGDLPPSEWDVRNGDRM
jgi:GNAT superfamily N-acetyltransferase